jgi:hypothetical protein
VLINNGDGTFGRMQTAPLTGPDRVAIAAIPGRARGVVLARGVLGEEVAVIEIARDGTLQTFRRWSARGGQGLAVGDVDGDLRPDVVAGAIGGIAVLRSTCLP